ncbi:putative aminopeptidase-2 [Colletes gigas]|uniref:putative aminopeptidase-2 n=1 Tax=Colletes gigas TaxID=935657 RepID=UPI001C9B9CD9|nr:putative aminopeptidase-2 [Colletes gigas]
MIRLRPFTRNNHTNVMDTFRAGVLIIFILLFGENRAIYRDIDTIRDAETFVENGGNCSTVDYRLPKTIVPTNYEIILIPSYEGDFKFEGTVHIKALVQQDTDTITLHHGRISITGMSVNYENNTIGISATCYDNKTEQFQLKLKSVLEKGMNIVINFQYTGTLRDDMIGFYKSLYFDSNGKIRWLASTQFQTTHARHAFPCFDEPSLKATFQLRILKKQDYTCLSNMPLARSIAVPEEKNTYWEDFGQSIPMSTYLVAFMISDFKYLGGNSFKVWARPDAIDQARYAMSIGPKALDHLSKLFKQEYQIPKMDMVAVPDFSAGAMENWGLVTYRESRLLYDGNTTSDAAKQSIASVIVHELTHMWFGNMITFEWWSYLWLSEAFARYYQYFGTAQIETSWNMEDQFVVEQHQTALAADGLETSKPMTRQILNSVDVSGAGDTITYNKGASVLRMMNAIFGQDVFEAVLQNYLKNNKENKVARPENLWSEFQAEIDRRAIKLASSVNNVMTTWTEQPGYPVLHVSVKNGVATVQQKRFLLRNLKSTATNLTWWVPITWASKDEPNFNDMKVKHWLNRNESEVKLNTNSGWVIFNVQSTGFYRVNYDNNSWYRIIDVLNSEDYQQIHVLNRAALVDDLLNLARAGLLDYATALNGVRYIKKETNYLPFKSAFTGLNYLDQRFSGNDEHYQLFKRFVLSLIQDIYENLGYLDRVNDDRLTVLLRSELNKWACNYGHEECIETFTTMFKKWRTTNVPTIKPNQREAAYCTAIKHGSQEDWEFLWKEYSNSNSATEQSVILQALGCTQDNAIRERYLLYALQSFETSKIRRQDSTAVFSAVSSSSLSGAEFLLNFIDKYHAKMTEYYEGPSTIATILSSASQRLSTRKSVDGFANLIQKHATPFDSILSSLRNSLDIAEYELKNFGSFSDQIASWMTDNTIDYYRLPENIIPVDYLIDVTPHIETFTFDGEVTIQAQVATKTNKIVLHSSEIKHDKITVSLEGKLLNIDRSYTTEKYDFLTIVLSEQLPLGSKITIAIKYSGSLNEEMRGFYRSSYTTSNGDTRWLAATHLEPVGARKLFPCFDEPAMKANFTMQVTLEKGYNAISNMPIEKSTTIGNGGLGIKFQETPKMSTYLVALVVSDFNYIVYNDIYKVWSRPDAINQGTYALSIMESLVKYYENVLNIPYKLPKLDMVALPDFASGAMENWGLLTYKERNVLYSDKESTTATKQSIANVISHEISHQWFGNLVSPLWWKYLWLNEGFARYYQYFGTDNVEKDWSLVPQFVVEQLHSALETDSYASSHAMTHNVYSPTEIRGIFDTISYAKGASVIRMLRELFGANVFHKSLHNYLTKLQYDVATPNDLFDAFKEQITDNDTRDSFDNIMNTWTTQPGYPVVRFTIKSNSLHLKQERFLIERSKDASSEKPLWYVPITWTSPNKPSTNASWLYWFYKAEDNVPLSGCDTDLCIFNDKQAGFYRTNYEDDHWRRIITFLKTKSYDKINEINRATIIDDLMNFARSGYVDYEIALSATQYLVNERNYVPWRAFFNSLTYLRRQFQGRDAFDAYKRYLTALLTPIYDELKFEDQKSDKHERLLLRMYVRKWACELGVSDCEANATLYFKTWYGDQTQNFPANYRGVSYCAIARTSPSDYWDILWSLYMNTTVASHKSVILQSLACTTQPTYLNKLLNKAITKNSGIRFEDSPSVFSNVIDASLEGVDYVIDFVKTNYNEINKYYRGDVSKIKSIVLALARRLSTEKLYAKYMNLIAWLEEKEFSSFGSSLNTYKNRAAYELTWAESYIPKLHEWMETNYPDTDYRLPKLHSPLKYNISLSPHFQERNFTFTGRVQISTRCLRNTSRIVLNSHQLKINKVSIYKSDSTYIGEELNVNSIMTTENTQKLTVFMKNIIRNDEILIDIEFEGVLNDKMEGFYRSYYFNNVMNISWLATTQFEPTHARKAFPCFDEPALKATFVVNIERPEKYVALSNMPSKKTSPIVAGRVWETFDETPTMSTYLIAFVVSDFETVRNSYVTVNIWGRPSIAPSGDYAQIAAPRMLEILATKTNQEYTLPKLDLIGIPDFSMGAMENWGLATFREYGLFYNEKVTTAKYADYILTIIAHELAHMWYGNLVTCDWWEHIWLNEGFAEYMQWQVAQSFKPGHNFEDLFVVDELQVAMKNDDYVSSHPMNNPVSKPSEIANVFDSIAYGKSSSVIRMIKNSLAPEVFSKATQRYLRENRYSNTSPKDLWKAFDAVINETHAFGDWKISMETLMNSWTNEAGYPVVSATSNGNKITLTQKRFSLNQHEEPTKVYFWIPITMASASNVNFITTATNVWLGEKSLDVEYKPGDWFILNVQQSGYYRVNYDDDSWLRLIKALRQPTHSSIHQTNRAQVIDDLLNLARGSYIDYNLALNGTTYLIKEKHYLPWRSFFNDISFIAQRYEGYNDSRDLLGKYIMHLTSDIYNSIGFMDSESENHLDQLARELILTWVCKFNDTKCVDTSKKLFANWRQAQQYTISPNARPAVYCTALKHGSIEDWRFLWEQYLKADFASEKKIILDALGCTLNKELLHEYIGDALNVNYTSSIRKQDVSAALASVYSAGQFGLNVMLDYLLENYEEVYKYYGEWESVGDLFLKVASRFSTKSEISKLQNFADTKKDSITSISSMLDRAIAAANKNYNWYNSNFDKINSWLTWYQNSNSKSGTGRVVASAFSIISMTVLSIIVYIIGR